MTIEELIKELEKYPKGTRVYDECVEEIHKVEFCNYKVVPESTMPDTCVLLKPYWREPTDELW